MSTLLIRNCRAIVTCDDGDRVYENADLFCQDVPTLQRMTG